MPVHPQVDLAIKLAGDIPSGLSPAELRRHYDAARLPLQPPRPKIHDWKSVAIPTRNGSIDGRLYIPEVAAAGPSPTLVYFHGGGWVVGSLEGYDTLCRELANASGWKILSVGYRLSPEHKFPSAVEDAHDAVIWAYRNAGILGIDPGRIAVGGDSAGANLSAVVCHLCGREAQPKLFRQILIYGAFDLAYERASYEQYASGYMLSRDALRWFIEQYLKNPEQKYDWRASPIRADRFDGQPPALFIVAECDPLADENAAYAQRLESHGVPVEYVVFQGMIHPFLSLGGVIDAAKEAEQTIANYLRVAAGEIPDQLLPG